MSGKARCAAIVVALAAAVISLSPALAKDRMVHCKLKVDGRVYLDGPCTYSAERDGSFTIGAGTKAVAASTYFAYVTKNDDGSADATWNKDPKSIKAGAPLGSLHQRGACWVNEHAEVCAY